MSNALWSEIIEILSINFERWFVFLRASLSFSFFFLFSFVKFSRYFELSYCKITENYSRIVSFYFISYVFPHLNFFSLFSCLFDYFISFLFFSSKVTKIPWVPLFLHSILQFFLHFFFTFHFISKRTNIIGILMSVFFFFLKNISCPVR